MCALVHRRQRRRGSSAGANSDLDQPTLARLLAYPESEGDRRRGRDQSGHLRVERVGADHDGGRRQRHDSRLHERRLQWLAGGRRAALRISGRRDRRRHGERRLDHDLPRHRHRRSRDLAVLVGPHLSSGLERTRRACLHRCQPGLRREREPPAPDRQRRPGSGRRHLRQRRLQRRGRQQRLRGPVRHRGHTGARHRQLRNHLLRQGDPRRVRLRLLLLAPRLQGVDAASRSPTRER